MTIASAWFMRDSGEAFLSDAVVAGEIAPPGGDAREPRVIRLSAWRNGIERKRGENLNESVGRRRERLAIGCLTAGREPARMTP
ncbi:MAG: hypothetical protein KDB35_15080 [Acidimicrobiales bacterium]|nr:hypothetical protein [Acidimicrobiales bacterium]